MLRRTITRGGYHSGSPFPQWMDRFGGWPEGRGLRSRTARLPTAQAARRVAPSGSVPTDGHRSGRCRSSPWHRQGRIHGPWLGAHATNPDPRSTDASTPSRRVGDPGGARSAASGRRMRTLDRRRPRAIAPKYRHTRGPSCKERRALTPCRRRVPGDSPGAHPVSGPAGRARPSPRARPCAATARSWSPGDVLVSRRTVTVDARPRRKCVTPGIWSPASATHPRQRGSPSPPDPMSVGCHMVIPGVHQIATRRRRNFTKVVSMARRRSVPPGKERHALAAWFARISRGSDRVAAPTDEPGRTREWTRSHWPLKRATPLADGYVHDPVRSPHLSYAHCSAPPARRGVDH